MEITILAIYSQYCIKGIINKGCQNSYQYGGGITMDIAQELYYICAESEKKEEFLMKIDKELLTCIESNVSDSEKVIFLSTIDSIIKRRESYFFKAGFKAAIQLIVT